jgi:hypothetical protein
MFPFPPTWVPVYAQTQEKIVDIAQDKMRRDEIGWSYASGTQLIE